MAKYEKLAEQVIEKMFSGFAVDMKTGGLTVVAEADVKKADEALTKVFESVFRDKWEMLEAADDSLRNIAGEVDFASLNADPSSTGGSATDLAPADAAGAPAMESTKTFNFKKIFEGLMDEPESAEVSDGDQDFQSMQMGAGDAGQEGGTDSSGGGQQIDADPAAIGGQQDPMMDAGQQGGQVDPLAADGQQGGDQTGADASGGFDLTFGDDGQQDASVDGQQGAPVPGQDDDIVPGSAQPIV